MKRKNILSIAAICLSILAMTFAFSSCKKKVLTPTEYLSDAIVATLESRSDLQLISALEATMNGGSAEITLNKTDDLANLGLPINKITGKMYLNAAAQNLALIGSANVGGADFDVSAFASNKDLILSSTALLGEGAYGVDYTKITENYKNSVFCNKNSQFYLGEMPSEVSTMLDSLKNTDISGEKNTKLLEKYGDKLSELVSQNSSNSVVSEDGGKVVTFELNSENVKNIIKSLYAEAKADTELSAMVSEYMELFSIIIILRYGSDNALAEYEAFFASEDSMDEFLKELDKSVFTVKFTAHTDKSDIIKTAELVLDGTTTEDKERYVDTLTVEIADNSTAFSFKIEKAEDGGSLQTEESGKISYVIIENTADKYSAELKYEQIGATLNLLGISYDKKTGDFEVNSKATALAFGGQDCLKVFGNYKETKTSAEIKITKVSVPVADSADFDVATDLTIKLLVKDVMPSFPTYTDILTMSEEKFGELAARIAALTGGIGGDEY